MKNWKTTLFGASGIIYALVNIISNMVIGTPENINWSIDIPVVLSGFGLIVAKDAGVTGTAK